MSELTKQIGKRIRNYRIERRISQEKLAELSKCHPTYIGQIERGEKNATIESIEKIVSALGISLSTLFDGIGSGAPCSDPTLLACYDILSGKSAAEREALLAIFKEIERYRNI